MGDAVEIKPGDVLLFHGNGFVSWGIRKFDGTDVNHAAVALDATTLGEAGGRGLQRTAIEKAVKSNKYMKVRRHGDAELVPVLDVATRYLDEGRPYAYQQIVLLALLASTRKIRLTGVAKRMLRTILDHGAAALNAFLDRDGNRSMICSEFVYRAFGEALADPADRYRILVQVGDTAFDAPGGDSLVDWALAQPDDLLEAAAKVPVSFSPTTMADPAAADEAAEADLAPVMAAWAAEEGIVDDDLPPAPPVSFGLEEEEPSDEELLASLVNFGGALADATSDGAPSFGVGGAIGSAAARGAISAILTPRIEANFVTPGDLLLSPTLVDVGTVQGG